ncbi:uncharacterized protein NPIL_90771 [Nephila pilipes]|uniref:Mutator-like transposase domain-containing protein n=1 Tax=Nephila pilipes TaxID=299642 RepID=A0A8X6M9D1_NEPPI|nr:uncharacterized protein NPIL_90771 [Nephila pilipes]
MFCGIMNLPPPPTKFTKFNNILLQAARETCEESMPEAVHEAVEENDGARDIAVAVDGSWQKRGKNITSSSNSTLDADVSNNEIKTGIQNSCAKERKVPNLNASFSTFEGNIGTQIATVNTNYVYAMRSIGGGAEVGRMSCALMNLPQPPTRLAPYKKRLLNL